MPRRSEFHAFLDEDVGRGDITSELVVPRKAKARGRIVAKRACVVAGLEEAGTVFRELGLTFDAKARDGARVSRGEVVAKVRGRARSLLKGERVALNILQRMSGIATLTRATVEAGRRANPRLIVAATRKTTPGFRAFEKRAVALGGGDPHRFALDDMVLVKDNHLAVVGGVERAMAALGPRGGKTFTKKVEVEVSNLEDALKAAELGADIVMLDNFPARSLGRAYRALKARYPGVLVEVSGNIDASNIAKVAPFADIVSCGSLTHSAPACDFSLEVEPEP
ncbi:MAG TPA: carboxylating nicotinate-nucleotide diphosphorylase [Candidatus Thermoplasmatota archaeon]|nr:carboxylating nicotinate-nucleotide diphosphorylase [Candidatus Thermoplasmatota archaeon]